MCATASTTRSTSCIRNDRPSSERNEQVSSDRRRREHRHALAGAAAAYTYLGEPAANQPSAAGSGSTEECWDEQVATVTDPRDRQRIVGTAVGAVGRDVRDRHIKTVVGAAAGAMIGRKIQEEIHEDRAEQRTVTTTERRAR
jgi:hypothetical protein